MNAVIYIRNAISFGAKKYVCVKYWGQHMLMLSFGVKNMTGNFYHILIEIERFQVFLEIFGAKKLPEILF